MKKTSRIEFQHNSVMGFWYQNMKFKWFSLTSIWGGGDFMRSFMCGR